MLLRVFQRCGVLNRHTTSILKRRQSEFTVCRDDEKKIDVMRRLIQERSTDKHTAGNDAFYVMDLGYFVKSVMEWKRLLPRVYPYYAVKANPDPVLLQFMTKLKFGYDCASMNEIKMITGKGNPPTRIIYANTRKQPSHLRYAESVGVKYTTVDDEDELHKIKQNTPNMRLLLRLSTLNFSASLSEGMCKKFGCSQQEAYNLLKTARELGLTVNGVSFHVGSGCSDPHAFSKALQLAKEVFMNGAELGYNMNILDIGGGFASETTNNYGVVAFSLMADVIRKALDEYFPEDNAVQIIAEPGAYFMMPSTDLVTNIIGTKNNIGKQSFGFQEHEDGPEIEYFINDGNQSSLFVYNLEPDLIPVAKPVSKDYFDAPTFKCKIWGQTCDEDVIMEECQLPKMKTGDWIHFTEHVWKL
ncbi:ornithine decarboxylase-like isoform X2 [Apostichopus japonicus]|uniref:ornithine decarboxylase-like isoform X2 n=1 Tax=Stichopus japonicus TaxID=307972 RepID=UPI003AB1C1F3